MSITPTTWDPDNKDWRIELSEDKLSAIGGGSFNSIRSIFGTTSGKYYWEIGPTDIDIRVGVMISTNTGFSGDMGERTNCGGWGYRITHGSSDLYFSENHSHYGSDIPAHPGGIIGIALDMDIGNIFFSLDGSWQASSDPVTGANPAISGLSGIYHAGITTYGTNIANFGASAFQYTVPTGYISGFGEEAIEIPFIPRITMIR
jgi:hypothetical protein